MRTFIIPVIIFMLLAGSCASTRKNTGSKQSQATESNIPGTTTKRTLMPSRPVEENKEIKEEVKVAEPEKEVKGIEKKIIADKETSIIPKRYFVIVGSFRNPANAKKRQSEIKREGFTSEILKTEEGLYRISVLSTDNEDEARNEVRRIWLMFPQYSDTWMLISKP